jgi:hypothetical protein
MELMFRNSLRYNTDKKSRIVLMTKRLKEFFLDKFQNVVKVSAAMPTSPPPPNNRLFGYLLLFGTGILSLLVKSVLYAV